MLDNPRIGVVHLDRREGILAVNDRARSILRHGDELTDRGGGLGARAPADQIRLERLVGAALPASVPAAVSGSMLLRRSPVLPTFVVHVQARERPSSDYGARHLAALVLILEPGRKQPARVATPLELTPGEVAVWLAEGKSARAMAEATEPGCLSIPSGTIPGASPANRSPEPSVGDAGMCSSSPCRRSRQGQRNAATGVDAHVVVDGHVLRRQAQ